MALLSYPFRRSLFIILLGYGIAVQVQAQADQATIDGIYTKLEELQSENDRLKKALEQQQAKIDILESQTLQRYVQLDQRLDQLGHSEDGGNEAYRDIDFAAKLRVATQHLQSGEYQQAHNLLSEILIEHPDDAQAPIAWFWLGEASIALKQYLEAEQAFGYIIAAWPDHWRVAISHLKLGDIFLARDEIEFARAKYTAVLRDYPNHSAARVAKVALQKLELKNKKNFQTGR